MPACPSVVLVLQITRQWKFVFGLLWLSVLITESNLQDSPHIRTGFMFAWGEIVSEI